LKDDRNNKPVAVSTMNAPVSAIDREAMIAQMGDFDGNAIEMLKLFIDMTQPLIKRIGAAMEHNDLEELHEAGHSLKGAARSACLNDLGEAAAQLQSEAENNGQCGPVVKRVFEEFERAREEITAL
jgi:HPt (histidine-containing phosphotransfer) domain-containing protein